MCRAPSPFSVLLWLREMICPGAIPVGITIAQASDRWRSVG